MIKKLSLTISAVFIILAWIIILQVTRPFLVQDYLFGPSYTAIGMFFFTCIFTPLWEELIFRWTPIMLARKIHQNTGHDYTIYAILLSSYIFGAGHSNGIYGILLQGIGGVILSYLFILNGYKYWYNVLAHSLWNMNVLYLFPALGM